MCVCFTALTIAIEKIYTFKPLAFNCNYPLSILILNKRYCQDEKSFAKITSNKISIVSKKLPTVPPHSW